MGKVSCMMDLHEVHNDSKFDQLTASILMGIVTLRFESATILNLILTQCLMIKVKCCFEKIQEYFATVTSNIENTNNPVFDFRENYKN